MAQGLDYSPIFLAQPVEIVAVLILTGLSLPMVVYS
jgi:hypothetical protein